MGVVHWVTANSRKFSPQNSRFVPKRESFSPQKFIRYSLGIKKAIFQEINNCSIYLLDYVLPQVAKLSRALQTENLDLSMIFSLLDATLHSIDNAVLSSSNWVLELLEAAQDLETAIEEQIL